MVKLVLEVHCLCYCISVIVILFKFSYAYHNVCVYIGCGRGDQRSENAIMVIM